MDCALDRIFVQESLDDLAAFQILVDDGLDVVRFHLLIERSGRLHDDDGTSGAKAVAPGRHDQVVAIEPTGLEGRDELVPDVKALGRDTARASADHEHALVGLGPGVLALGDRLEDFRFAEWGSALLAWLLVLGLRRRLLLALEELFYLAGLDVPVDLVADLHHWSDAACAEAGDGLEAVLVVRGGLAGLDAEDALVRVEDAGRTLHVAGRAQADLAHRTAGLFAQLVERGLRDVAEALLDVLHHLDDVFRIGAPLLDDGADLVDLTLALADRHGLGRCELGDLVLGHLPRRSQRPMLGNQCLELLVAEHPTDAAATGLLDACDAATPVPEREVEHTHPDVVGCSAGRDHRDVAAIELVVGIHAGQLFGEEVRVDVLHRTGLNRDRALRGVDDHHSLLTGLADDDERVEASELEVGPEVAADVGVDHDAGHRRDRGDEGLAGARKGQGAGERTRGHTDRILGAVPLGLLVHLQEREPQVKAFAPGPEVLHLLGNRIDLDSVLGEVNAQRSVGVAIDDRRDLEIDLGKNLMRVGHLFETYCR